MNDRELLELAAKAAGISIKFFNIAGDPVIALEGGGPESCLVRIWQPLTDDGDALRLAAKLRISVRPGKHHGDGCSVDKDQKSVVTVFRDSRDMAEQMRYAITLAAAEIGKAMP